MTYTCTHESATERQGDTYYVNGRLRVVIHAKCANPFCVLFGQTVHTRVEGDDLPVKQFRMPPVHRGIKP
jgi:hypothetical protein